jgi:hypothetical protein
MSIPDFVENTWRAYREWGWGMGRSFWGTLATYGVISAALMSIALLMLRVFR